MAGQRAPPPPADDTARLTILTLNVRGLGGGFSEHLRHTLETLRSAPPDVIVLTETKHAGKLGTLRQLLGSSLRGYTLACTAAPVSEGRAPRAGVLVAVRTAATAGMTLTFVTPQATDELAGYYVRADLAGGEHLNLE
jgi:exonuclease III